MQRVRDAQVRVQVVVREAVQQAAVQRRVRRRAARAAHARVLHPAQRPRRVQRARQAQLRVAVPALRNALHSRGEPRTPTSHKLILYPYIESIVGRFSILPPVAYPPLLLACE